MMDRFNCLESTCQKLRTLAPDVLSSRHLVIKPYLGLLVQGLATASDLILSVVQVFQEMVPDLRITLAGCGQNDVSGSGLLHRSGLMALAADQGWDLIDLVVEPMYQLQAPRMPLPLSVPGLAFTDHVLVSIAPLAVHASERLSGMVANQLDLFPATLAPNLWPLRYQAAQLATRIWPPDLCVLDARHVVCWRETKLKRSVTVAPLDAILIGHGPWAVDREATRLLGLSPQQVPMLRYADKRAERPADQVELIAPNQTGPVQSSLPSPYAYSDRMVERVQRTTWHVNQMAAHLVDFLDLPRWIDFVRRAQGLEG